MSTPYKNVNTAMQRVADAIERLLDAARPISESEQLPLLETTGRVCARDVMAVTDIPPFTNSAMDGYAFASADFCEARTYKAFISQRIQAGDVPRAHTSTTAARIFTGAPLPPGCDTVLAQEETNLDEDGHVQITGPLVPGRFVRQRGEDVRHGQVIIPAGQRLHSQHIGLAAATGVTHLPVWRRPRVAVFATGNELVERGGQLTAGKIFNSNSAAVCAFLNQNGCEATECGIIPDNLDVTAQCLRRAAEHHDIIMTTGGASVGDEDHVKRAVEEIGVLSFWRVAIKPGKPFAFGQIGSTAFIGLPGNPVSTLITLRILVRPFLRRCQGEHPVLPALARQVNAGFDYYNDSVRVEYLRVRLDQKNGDWIATPYPNQSSGVLTSLTWAQGVVGIDPHVQISHGDHVDFYPFDC